MDGQSQPKVFLSYAHADQVRVAKIAEALTAAGMNVWWDTAIEGGASFSSDIERELEAADAVVVAWSATSVKSTWVLDEAGHGRDRGRLVPVQLDVTSPPLGFRQFQAVDLSAWKGRAGDPKFAALLSAIQKLGGAPAVAPVAKAVSASTGPSRRALFGGVAGVAALAAGGFGAWKAFGGKDDDGTASVAVLPFANLSGDPAQAFFSDGIAEELRNALSQIRGLKVIGRVSSEKFRATDDLSAAAEKLGIDHVLTGSVRRSPTTIRIGAQLVDGKTGAETWSQSYDEPVGDALAIQSKIASSVILALSAQLGAATGVVAVGGTDSPAAQELFLKAEAIRQTGVTEQIQRQRLGLVDAAISLDPRYAEAIAVKGLILTNLAGGFTDSMASYQALQAQALANTRRAVEIAPNSGFARVTLALALRNGSDVRGAFAEGERGIALAPGDWRIVELFGIILSPIDPDRAVALTQRGLALDPLNPRPINAHARALSNARRFQEAADMARQVMKLTSNKIGAFILMTPLVMLGQLEAARQLLPFLPEVWAAALYRAIIEDRAGNRPASDAAIAAFGSFDDDFYCYQRAQIHAQRGEIATALDALELGLKIGDIGLVEIAVDPLLDPLRKEPRFKAVQDKIIPPDLFVPPKRG